MGAPPPRADSRLALEAIWITLEVRYEILEFGQVILKVLKNISSADRLAGRDPKNVDANIVALPLFLYFVLESSINNVRGTIATAADSKAERQLVEGHIRLLRTRLELCRLRVHFDVDADPSRRSECARKAEITRDDALGEFNSAIKKYRSLQPRDQPEIIDETEGWLATTILPSKERVLTQWEDVIKYARATTFDQEVTREDRMEAIRAMRFAATGHWFTCPQGHPYVIGEVSFALFFFKWR